MKWFLKHHRLGAVTCIFQSFSVQKVQPCVCSAAVSNLMGWWVLLLDGITEDPLSQRDVWSFLKTALYQMRYSPPAGNVSCRQYLSILIWRPIFNFLEIVKTFFRTMKILNCNDRYFCKQFFIPLQHSPVTPSKWYCHKDAVGLSCQLARNIGFICFFSLLTFRQYVTPHSATILEKITVLSPINTTPVFYVNRSFSPVFTRGCHLPLYWARWIQSTSFHPVSIRSILMQTLHYMYYAFLLLCLGILIVMYVLFHCVVLCIVCV